MSAINSAISIPTVVVYDPAGPTPTFLQVGTVYRAAPAPAADGESQLFRISSTGELLVGAVASAPLPVVGNVDDQDPDAGAPVKVGAKYNAAPITYTDQDRSDLQSDINGYLITRFSPTDFAVLDQIEGYIDGVETLLAAISAQLPATLGQKTSANSLAVVLASDQPAIPVTISSAVADQDPDTENPIKVGGRYDAALPTYNDGDKSNLHVDVNGRLLVKEDTLSRNSGAVDANTLRTKFCDEDFAILDQIEGYVDGIETLLTAISAQLPATLGQKTSANSLAVVLASDQSAIPIGGDVADQAPDAGDPVKVGGRYDAALPTLTDGDRSNLHVDVNGRLLVKEDTLSRDAGAVDANTLRTKFCDEDFAILDQIEGYVDGIEGLLTAISAQLPATLGQKTMANSLAVVLPSDQIPDLKTNLDVVDFLDLELLDASVDNIPESSNGTLLELVASLAADVRRLQVFDTTGAYLGIYTGGVGVEVLKCITGPGMDSEIQAQIPSGTRISVRNMVDEVVDDGNLAINFLG